MIKQVVILAVFLLPSLALAEAKIGYVDIESALANSRAGERAQEQYEKEVKSKRSSLETKQNKLKKLQDRYADQRDSLSDTARAERQEEIIALEKDLQRSVKDTQEELRRKNGQVVGDLIRKIRGVVSEIGEEDGYTVILEKRAQPVLYADDAIDITDKVVKRFDELD